MRFDETQFQGVVFVVNERAKGLWSAQTQVLGGRVTRTGGHFNKSTAHTLLAIALIAGLQTVTNTQARELCMRFGVTKPKLLIKAAHPTFLTALQDHVQGRIGGTLFVPPWLGSKLVKALERFDCVYKLEPDPCPANTLLNWGFANVIDTEPPFAPRLVSVTGKYMQATGEHVRF